MNKEEIISLILKAISNVREINTQYLTWSHGQEIYNSLKEAGCLKQPLFTFQCSVCGVEFADGGKCACKSDPLTNHWDSTKEFLTVEAKYKSKPNRLTLLEKKIDLIFKNMSAKI